ncbi:MAG: type III pantothenate kinase [Clostridia bacterium]|nr:type III pantothenate kinase [Clostridia bacterium]
MLICVDIGNTNITLGGYKEEKLVFTARLTSDARRTADQYAVEIYDILRLNGHASAEVQGAILSSVVPTLTKSISMAFNKLCGFSPMMLGPGVKTGLNIKIDNPAQLGADLVAGAIGAMAKYPLPCIVIDMGTATTISAINEKGEFLGGAIAAGINLTLEALTKNTAQLPMVGIEAPKSAIGSNTIDCLKSGLVLGAAAMLDGLIDRMETELGQSATVVATGGLCGEIIPHCKRKIFVDDNLLLDGLKRIYEKNR